jgi:hypothetical protein
MTCRDRNRLALQSDLLGALALGVRNVLVIGGDDPKAGDQPETKPVFDLDSRALLAMAQRVSAEGRLPAGGAVRGATGLLLGAAAMPFDPPPDWDAADFLSKATAGAVFVQTQFCLDVGVVRRWIGRLDALGLSGRLKILVGLAPIRSARWMRERLYGTIIPDAIIERLESAADSRPRRDRDLRRVAARACGNSGYRRRAPDGAAELRGDPGSHRGFRICGRIGGATMAGELLLVGSIPLDTAEEVFRRIGGPLGAHLAYLPDGEIGDRRYWIDGIAYRVFNGHPEIETLRRPAPDASGVESWRPLGMHDQFQFRVKPGVTQVRFGDPGWRLGYTKDAVSSHFAFRTLQKAGVIPADVRFQVCLPLTYSAIGLFFPDPADQAKVARGLTQAFRAEVAKMVELIPPENLAIQWDLAVENRLVDTALAREGAAAAEALAARLSAPAAEIAAAIPQSVALGYHGCFGMLSGWPSRQPPDLAGAVILLNAMVRASGRRVNFLHLPTLGTADDAFFAPLAQLKAPEAKLYLGAIHHMHDEDGLRRQIRAARRHVGKLGLAAPCGFGRAPERPGRLLTAEGSAPPPDILDVIVRDHLMAVELLHEAGT